MIRTRRNHTFFLVVMLVFVSLTFLTPVVSDAKQEIVTVTSRYDVSDGGKEITLPYLLDIPEGREVTALLLVIPRGNGRINLRTKDGKIRHDVNNDPFIRNTALFHERSIGLDKESNPCLSRTKHGFFGLDGHLVAAISGWTLGQPPASPDRGNEPLFLNERIVWVPMAVMGGEVRLQTTVYKPDGPGPFPLAIISHGVPYEKSLEAEIRFRSRFCLQSEVFVKRGFAVAIPMRRGYGRSSGQKNETIVNIADFGLQDARDIQATIDFLSKEPFVDGTRIVLVGQSGGGLASLAYGSLGNPNVKGIINFAGGLRRSNVAMWEQDMAQAFGIYAKTTKAPSIWFYTANDSFFSPSTAKAAHESYRQSGGQARLVALPAFKRDGHGLFADFEGRAIWVGEVDKFLSQIDFAAATGRNAPDVPSQP